MQLANTLSGLQQQFNDWANNSAKLMGEYWRGYANALHPTDGDLRICFWDRKYVTNKDDYVPIVCISITDALVKILSKDDSYTDAEAQAALDAVIKTVNK